MVSHGYNEFCYLALHGFSAQRKFTSQQQTQKRYLGFNVKVRKYSFNTSNYCYCCFMFSYKCEGLCYVHMFT